MALLDTTSGAHCSTDCKEGESGVFLGDGTLTLYMSANCGNALVFSDYPKVLLLMANVLIFLRKDDSCAKIWPRLSTPVNRRFWVVGRRESQKVHRTVPQAPPDVWKVVVTPTSLMKAMIRI
jgi:hypothetical protein